MEKYDTIIIGAGPAGIAAAQTLIKNNQKCCVIEKSVFPRLKLCGGLLTQKTVRILEELGYFIKKSGIDVFSTNEFEIIENNNIIISTKCEDDFVLVERTQLDNFLANEFKKNGGILKEDERVLKIDVDNFMIITDKNQYKYKTLICADGINGISQRYIKNKKQQKAFCLEVSIPKDDKENNSSIKLELGLFPKGYGWVFPKAKTYCVGFGGTNYKEENYIEKFLEYVSKYTNKITKEDIKGAFLPFGKCDGIVCQKNGNMMLVGDAAGFVDVITGEGIYFALKSGMIAAQSIIKCNGDSSRILKIYKKDIKDIVKLTNRSNKLIETFYKHKNFCYKKVKEHMNFFNHFCNIQVSENKFNYNVIKIVKSYFNKMEK